MQKRVPGGTKGSLMVAPHWSIANGAGASAMAMDLGLSCTGIFNLSDTELLKPYKRKSL